MLLSIGGSASTGSSLLVQLLDRHRSIIAGPESHILARPQLFRFFPISRVCLMHRPRLLSSHGWHMQRGIDFPFDFYQISPAELNDCLMNLHGYFEFLERLDQLINRRNQTSVWCDKTPANVYCFSFLTTVKKLLTVRHPQEAIASMVHRGMDPIYASCRYLLDTGFGLSYVDTDAIVKYELLIDDMEIILESICTMLDLDMDFDWDKVSSRDADKMKGWRYAETELPAEVTHDRFTTLSTEDQAHIYAAIAHLRISDSWSVYGHKAKNTRFDEIMAILDYQMIGESRYQDVHLTRIKNYLRTQKWLRTRKAYPTHWLNFPIEVRD